MEKETDIQKAICDYLALKNHFFWRNNNVPIYNKQLDRFRSMPKYSMYGVPDIIVILEGGKVVFLEVKKKGGKLSEGQLLFMEKCTSVGAQYSVVYSIGDVINLGL